MRRYVRTLTHTSFHTIDLALWHAKNRKPNTDSIGSRPSCCTCFVFWMSCWRFLMLFWLSTGPRHKRSNKRQSTAAKGQNSSLLFVLSISAQRLPAFSGNRPIHKMVSCVDHVADWRGQLSSLTCRCRNFSMALWGREQRANA